MNVFTRAYLLQHTIRWRLTWDRRNTHYRFTVPGNPKFMGPRDAVSQLIRDGDQIAISGLGGQQRASIIYWAISELFQETGHPCNLTLLTAAGQGGRGKVPGTVDELGLAGLVRCLITGHLETFKSFLKLADQGQVSLQCLPQGVLALLIDAQARGRDSIVLKTGVGTFVDPRTGRGSPLTNTGAEQLVSAEDGQLRYRVPKINVAIFNAPAADREGNIYVKNCAMIGESYELAKAAKRNGGKVIVNVGLVVDKAYDDVFVPAHDVDAIVVYPDTEQTACVPHRRHWPMFTTSSTVPEEEGVARVRFINTLLGVTPRRSATDYALARLAASIFTQHATKGYYVNVGVGLPEEVCRLMFEAGLSGQVNLLTEAGVLGGLPLAGVFFGAAVSPTRIISSPEIFKLCYDKLDIAILGVLQVDSEGNVNASKRGDGAINYVGPGGFIDLATAAKTVIFVGSWMADAHIKVDRGRVRIEKTGKPKFVDKVDEITFNGKEALKADKKVFYVTNVGVFQLTERGMELTNVMPGIDIQKDILDISPMKVVLPESGDVPLVDPAIVTGKGFRLTLNA